MKVICSLFLFVFLSSIATAQQLSVTSFNIRFFGLGGQARPQGNPELEDRYDDLKQYFAENNLYSDIIFLQEVMTQEALDALLPHYHCYAPNNFDQLLMHPVTCVKPELHQVDNVSGTLVSTQLNGINPKLRALPYVVIKDTVILVNVHLIPSPEFKEERLNQIKMLKNELEQLVLKYQLPVLVSGDFNVYPGEIETFDQVLTPILTRQKHPFITYVSRSQETHLALDFMFTSTQLNSNRAISLQDFKLHGPCDQSKNNLEFYLRRISDHCPLSAKIELSEKEVNVPSRTRRGPAIPLGGLGKN